MDTEIDSRYGKCFNPPVYIIKVFWKNIENQNMKELNIPVTNVSMRPLSIIIWKYKAWRS